MTIRQGMEFLRVRADLQVDEFVDDDRLEHPARHGLEPMGDADVSRRRRRRSPTADVLVRHPPDRRRTQPSLEVPSAHLLRDLHEIGRDRKSTRLNSSHVSISYAVFCLKKKNIIDAETYGT